LYSREKILKVAVERGEAHVGSQQKTIPIKIIFI
jgi:hypothetical protein